MTARRFGLAVAVASALASGAYVFIYLYRWEWNRALIASAIFIAVEIALLGAAIIDRIGRLGRRMDDIERDLASRQVLDRIEESAPEPRRHFAWLTDFDKMGVFVPVLMGAGVVISAIAWAIERIAQKTARPVLERRLAARLAPIALPVVDAAAEPPGFPLKRSVARIATPLMLVVMVTASVVALAATTKNRPDQLRAGTESTVALSIITDGTVDPGSAARRLWHFCSETIPSELAAGSFEGSTGPDVSLNLRPGLGPNGERRLRGCLEDATLDHVQAAVVDVIHANR
jgi:hypothetical protein